ncbi:hypothetical protein KI387_025486, partial [Taxus chinensis]
LTHMKKESHETMREFVAKFNKLIQKIPVIAVPTLENQKCFFINAQPPDISFLLQRSVIPDLATAQSTATEIEDDLILAGRIKKDIPKLKNQGSPQ